MRWNVLCVTASLLITFAAAACSQKTTEMDELSMPTADLYTQPVQDSTYASDAYPAYGSTTPVETSFEAIRPGESTTTPTTTPGTRYHTVARHDTLYGLARTYYGQQARWKNIYEANRSSVNDPNMIYVGQRLVIP